MRNISDKNCGESENTHFMFNNFFYRYCAVSEMMWKNIVELVRPQRTLALVHWVVDS
jgi:hypothetical protein